MPADALTTAFILLQLGEHDAFRTAVRFDDAIDSLALNVKTLDSQTRRLWSHASARCRLGTGGTGRFATLWCAAIRSAA
jgi:hypothetical protein